MNRARHWADPSPDGRWPVPPLKALAGIDAGDIRETVRIIAQTEWLMQDIRTAFQASDEMRTLAATFDPTIPPSLGIGSSNKYTRFLMFNTPRLVAEITRILEHHGLLVNMDVYSYARDHQIQLTTVRIGAVNETIKYGDPCGPADAARTK